MNLLIDTGNSNIKLALSKGTADIHKKKSYPYNKQNFTDDLARIFKSYSSEFIKPGEVTGIGIAVTNPLLKKILREKFKKLDAVFIDNKTSPFVKINYLNKLGNDRVAAVNAAYELHRNEQLLVIDLGTATTLNLVVNGEFIGGSIVPGIQTGLNSLSTSTPLPKSGLKFERNLGKTLVDSIVYDNTRDSVAIGTTQQTLFYLERAVAELKKEYKDLYVVCTGGLSEFISGHTDIIDVTDKDLVLKGINFVLDSLKKVK